MPGGAQYVKSKLHPKTHAFTDHGHTIGARYGKMAALYAYARLKPTKGLAKGRVMAMHSVRQQLPSGFGKPGGNKAHIGP